ncbi:ATP-dependent DNA helicase UvrD/PcrA [hydrothermal vent metagenome]|uniref:DNA 3'-5' helicase n=1 Tax=hydrothermal vent metagenome TaxID=652676 RepID=A0A3B1B8M4_9ZZZZ
MDVSHILEGLNDAQREAVSASPSGMLVLAGAGSGKTRVLVHRIAWLLQVERVAPWSILAVTFTNKAAREMRDRIEGLLNMPVGGMWVGTFHGLAHRLLRAHWEDAGLPQNFQILDSDDQFRLIKRTMKSLNIDDARWPPRQAQYYINARKDEGLRPQHLDDGGDHYLRQMIVIYQEYQNACERGGLLDFADLLLRAHELWRDRSDVLQHYQERFQHVLVDEFQDTNEIQYAWLRLLTGSRNNLFAVGDDDQSIYGWRGAKVEHIQQFQQDYADSQLVRLEQNYRSTGNILKAANALIANNPSRLGKNLWTDDGDGDLIHLYASFNEVDEARFVIERIQAFVNTGNRRDEAAILYRSNAQSRQFEEALIQSQMPYRVYGGLRFFERAEIKDALGYLRIVSSPDDDAAFERAVNMPPRGIGPRTLDTVRAHARDCHCSMWQGAHDLLTGGSMTARASNALQGFLDLVKELRAATSNLTLAEITEHVIAASRLTEHFDKSKDGRGQDRIENLEELTNATRQFSHESTDDDLVAFISHAALEAGEAQGDRFEDCVQLMTLHSAKGLEFPLVFVTGLEEGLFPHSRSASDPEQLEEERRLCYVGMTRAMRQLYLSYAETRRLHGKESYSQPSRFLREIPAELLEEIRARPQVSKPVRHNSFTMGQKPAGGFHLGQRVNHAKFGAGVILNAEGQGSSARVQVNFENKGSKWLVVAYANLQPV